MRFLERGPRRQHFTRPAVRDNKPPISNKLDPAAPFGVVRRGLRARWPQTRLEDVRSRQDRSDQIGSDEDAALSLVSGQGSGPRAAHKTAVGAFVVVPLTGGDLADIWREHA